MLCLLYLEILKIFADVDSYSLVITAVNAYAIKKAALLKNEMK